MLVQAGDDAAVAAEKQASICRRHLGIDRAARLELPGDAIALAARQPQAIEIAFHRANDRQLARDQGLSQGVDIADVDIPKAIIVFQVGADQAVKVLADGGRAIDILNAMRIDHDLAIAGDGGILGAIVDVARGLSRQGGPGRFIQVDQVFRLALVAAVAVHFPQDDAVFQQDRRRRQGGIIVDAEERMLLRGLPDHLPGLERQAIARFAHAGRGDIDPALLDRGPRVPAQANGEAPGQPPPPRSRRFGVTAAVNIALEHRPFRVHIAAGREIVSVALARRRDGSPLDQARLDALGDAAAFVNEGA